MRSGGNVLQKQLQLAVVLAAALAATAVTAAAQESRIFREGDTWVEEITGALSAASQLEVKADMGGVKLVGGAQPGITWTVRKRAPGVSEEEARRQFQAFRVRAHSRGGMARLLGECARPADCRARVDFVVTMPRELALARVETRAGNVLVDELRGRLDLTTAGGNVEVGSAGGAVAARTMGGHIHLKKAGGDAVLSTAGGNIHIGSVQGKVNATTYGGSIKMESATGDAELATAGGGIWVKKCGGRLEASTAGGVLEIGEVAGPVTLRNAGGGIRLFSAGGPVTATTGGGAVQLSNLTHGARVEAAAGAIRAQFASGASFAESQLVTAAGDIVVMLPADLAVTVRAAIQMSSGHQIRSDFPEVRITTNESGFGPKEVYGEGGINGGGPVLRIRTIAGNIDVRRVK
jgi:DUF4097 and DUF4098 domain-containing protein YvlB